MLDQALFLANRFANLLASVAELMSKSGSSWGVCQI